MRASIFFAVLSALSFLAAFCGAGAQLLSDAEAATILGGDCDSFSDSQCVQVSSCEELNESVFFNECGPGSQGAVCVRCSNASTPLEVCATGAQDRTCGPLSQQFIDCGLITGGQCQEATGTCNNAFPTEDPCDDAGKCCTGFE